MKKPPLAVEELEDRTVLTTFGVPWPDPKHLTLSFVPDQSPAAGGSDLFRTLDALAPPAVWQTEILRAFQTWAQYANINIGLVSDDGEPLGVAGAPQGDPRFGDIRVAAFPLGSQELAVASPFDVLAGTNSGDVRLNSNYFTGASSDDLFSIFLHEAGHVLGLPDSDDPASPMYPTYQGVRTGPTADDIANLQALYGPRAPDAFDAKQSNDTLATALFLSPAGQSPNLSANADLTTSQDVDWYRFKLNGSSTGLTIQLHTAGISLLEGRLRVYDTAGNLLGSATADTPGADLQIHLSQASSTTYYVKVEKAVEVFAIGSYQLDITPDATPAPQTAQGGGTPPAPTNPALSTTLQSPLPLQPPSFRTDARFDYAYSGGFAAGGGTEYFRLNAPQAQPGEPQVMTVMAWATQPAGLQPLVTVYDANGTPVASELLVREDGTFVLQIPQAASNVDYIVAVQGNRAPGPTGFFLGVDFGPSAVQLTTFADNQALGPGGTSLGTLNVDQGGLFHFVLSASAALQMQLFDSNGNLVRSLAVAANDPASLTVSLAPGNYFFLFSGADATTPVQFTLRGTNLDDPIGPELIDPTLAPLPVGGASTSGSTVDAYSYLWDTSYYLFLSSTSTGSLTTLSGTDLTAYYAWLAWMSNQSALTSSTTTTTSPTPTTNTTTTTSTAP